MCVLSNRVTVVCVCVCARIDSRVIFVYFVFDGFVVSLYVNNFLCSRRARISFNFGSLIGIIVDSLNWSCFFFISFSFCASNGFFCLCFVVFSFGSAEYHSKMCDAFFFKTSKWNSNSMLIETIWFIVYCSGTHFQSCCEKKKFKFNWIVHTNRISYLLGTLQYLLLIHIIQIASIYRCFRTAFFT